jgi:MFS family permease
LSAPWRAVTAPLAPWFSSELNLQQAGPGLLAGAYFLGFAAMQLPLGRALDRFGPRWVLLALLSVAVLGCLDLAQATCLGTPIASRLRTGWVPPRGPRCGRCGASCRASPR